METMNLKIKRPLFWLTLLAILAMGCSRYYKPVSADTSSPEASRKAIQSYDNKLLILRQGNYSYGLGNVSVDNVALTLGADLFPLGPGQRVYVDDNNRRYTLKERAVLNEVHIYSKDTFALALNQSLTLPLDQITKIEVIEINKGATTTSYVLGGIGITMGVALVALVVIAATKSSCPFVSVYDGDQYVLQGELFGGAVNRQLARPDYVPIKTFPVKGDFQLRIHNELKEKQFTDYADLVIIEHPANQKATISPNGKTYLLSEPVAPTSAILNEHTDILETIRQMDQASCLFDDTLDHSSINEITLSFPRQGLAQNAKLVLNLKNSYWFDFLFGEFTSNFGSRYDHWQEIQNKRPAEKMIRWTGEQHIPLSISVRTPSGWQEIWKLNTVGPLMNREVVIPLGLTDQSQDPIQVKLSTGFMFWELDYAAVDFTAQERVTTTTLHPYSAIDENGNDVLDQISDCDGIYLTQYEVGNYATLKHKYDKETTPGFSYSVVLATQGYYQPIREFVGKPNIAFLNKFKTPGKLSTFSKEKYLSIVKHKSNIALN